MWNFIKKLFKKEPIFVDERLEHMMQMIIENERQKKGFDTHHIKTMKEVKEWVKLQEKKELEAHGVKYPGMSM